MLRDWIYLELDAHSAPFWKRCKLLTQVTNKQTFNLKLAYTSQLRSNDAFVQFLMHTFECLNLGKQSSPFDLSKWDISNTIIDQLQDSPIVASLLSSIAYLHTLKTVPSLTRVWFNACQNRQLTLSVSAYTQQYFAPLIMEEDFKSIETVKGMVVSVIRGSSNDVCLKYIVEECTLQLTIKVPALYPLRQVEVQGEIN
jgi:E3 ubiquitin-protein ligase listerin